MAEIIKRQENHSKLRNRLKCIDFDDFWDNVRLFCDQNPVISRKMIDNSRDQCKLTGKGMCVCLCVCACAPEKHVLCTLTHIFI